MTHQPSSPIRRSLLARFRRDMSGATAIEFGILAPIFFGIICALLETAMVFFAGQILDGAVQDASRRIRTGQAQEQAFTVTEFKDLVCGKLFNMFNCDNLRINVRTVTNFASATVLPPLPSDCTTSCNWALAQDFKPGKGSDTVIVQVYYKWPILLHLPAFAPNDLPDGTRLLGSVQVFRNEPFSS